VESHLHPCAPSCAANWNRRSPTIARCRRPTAISSAPDTTTNSTGLRELAKGGKQWIAAYQKRQMDETGIANIKVGYNKVFGYYLEVTNAHRDRIPDFFIRKQTLKELRTVHHAGIERVRREGSIGGRESVVV
jgi:DNA mismatch repair protein MutS